MKSIEFQINTRDFERAIQNAIAQKDPMDTESDHVILRREKSDKDILTVIRTTTQQMQTQVIHDVTARTVESEFSIAVSGVRILPILREIKHSLQILVEIPEGQELMIIKLGSTSYFRIHLGDVEYLYQSKDTKNTKPLFSIKTTWNKLKYIISKCQGSAMSRKGKNNELMQNTPQDLALSGILIEPEVNLLSATGCNTHHLSVCEVETTDSGIFNDESENPPEFILSRHIAEGFLRMKFPDAEEITISRTGEYILIESDDHSVEFRAQPGQYPDTRSLFPKWEDLPEKILLDYKKLLACVQSTQVIRMNNEQRIQINVDKDVFHFSGTNPRGEDVSGEVPCQYQGKEIKDAVFNLDYLRELIENIDSDQVEVYIQGINKSDYNIIIMPTADTKGYAPRTQRHLLKTLRR